MTNIVAKKNDALDISRLEQLNCNELDNDFIEIDSEKTSLIVNTLPNNVLKKYENSLQKYLSEINKIASLSQEEEFMLAKNFLENQDKSAAHKLVTSHLKLVAKIAISYKNYGLPIDEMISEGNIGLIHAVKKYNPDLGFRLSTYAMWWIKANIQDYILRSWSLVKIGTTAVQKKLFFSLSRLKNKISSLYFRAPNDQDYVNIAKDLGVSKKDVVELNERLYTRDMSLNQYVQNDNQNAELIDFLPETRPNQEVVFCQEQESMVKKTILNQGLSNLNARELYILQHRKLSDPIATLDELSNKFEISKERVRQIENRAFKKLQDFVLDKYNNVSADLLSNLLPNKI
jgi:RNA polymerase sigma-32 factor